MASKRSSIAMTPEEIRDYLNGPRALNVATIGSTGHPHIVAMWYCFHGGTDFLTGKLCFWTFAKSQKILNLRRNPLISALVEDGTPEYNKLRGVSVEGTGRIIEDYDEILEIGLSVGSRYSGAAILSDAARPFVGAQAKKRLGVVIDAERVISWDHSKLGGGY